MARYDVHENADRRTKGAVPYLVVLQHEIFDALATRLVVPLMPVADISRPLTRLNPIVEVDGARFVAMVPELAGVPRRALGPFVTSLAGEGASLLAAMDFLVSGS